MLELNFLLLAHKNPSQVARLVDLLLLYQGSRVFVHVDAKSQRVYEDLRSLWHGRSDIHLLTRRESVFWGSYGQILATLHLLRESSRRRADYTCLLSGQDLPLVPVQAYAEFLSRQNGKDFLEFFPLPQAGWQGGLQRLEYFWFDSARFPRAAERLTRWLARLQRVLRYRRPLPMPLWGGSSWFNLSAAGVETVLRHTDAHPAYLNAFRYSRCADEIYFQTILLNSPRRKELVCDNLRLIRWRPGEKHPDFFGPEDWDELQSVQGKFFARKFDPDQSGDVMQRLESHLRAAQKNNGA